MAKKDLSYWDEEVLWNPQPVKKSKKSKDKDHDETNSEYDDDPHEKLPLSQEYMDRIADVLEQFLTLVKTYFIYSELSPEQYKEVKKRIKSAVKRLRKGDTTEDFDPDRTLEAINNGDIPEKYIDGGY